ncbi:Uncharacterized protein HWI79_134 [Cryptosporidium felis]|nr:Uncharacterized protein HWI79_134 [Cryptosporidium felis]
MLGGFISVFNDTICWSIIRPNSEGCDLKDKPDTLGPMKGWAGEIHGNLFFLKLILGKYQLSIFIPFSTITCEFVPPNPKDETPAIRLSESMAISSFGISILEFISFKSNLILSLPIIFGGTVLCPSTNNAFSNPANPEAPSKWPILGFSVPIYSFFFRLPNTSEIAPNSIGSPRGVPVPCASKYLISLAAIHPSINADVITRF